MEKIGKYEILDKIGSGGFAVVYKGRDPFIKRLVAIKVCYSRDDDTRQRFYREAEIAGKLVHRNITTVYDFGLHGEMPYLVEEYLSGEDLAHAIQRREPEALEEKLECLLQIASGLAHAHSMGVIHRDVKPSNVRLLDSGRIKIMDFGTAKLANVESHLTQTGITLGTVAYLSPERLQGQPGNLNSDIFSFGVLAYELLSFRRPFVGRNIPALIDQLLNANPVPLTQSWSECPPGLAEIVHKCLRKDPQQRYASCDQVISDLEGFRVEYSSLIQAVQGPATRQDSATTPALRALELQLQALLQRARQNLEQGKAQRAEVLLQEVLELDPENAEARELLSRATPPAPDPPSGPSSGRWETPEEKRRRKIGEAVASIEGYLESGQLDRAAGALHFAQHLLGSFDEVDTLARRAIQLFRQQLAELRGLGQRHADWIVEKIGRRVAADQMEPEIAQRFVAWIEDVDAGNPEVEKLLTAIETAKRRRQQLRARQQPSSKRDEAVASIVRYLDAGDVKMAEKALDFALKMLGQFDEAQPLRQRIAAAQRGLGS